MGKILWSSLLLKPYLMHLELLWSTCQASIWPKPVPQAPHQDLSPRYGQEPDSGPQAICPTRHLAPSWPRRWADTGLCQLILGLSNWECWESLRRKETAVIAHCDYHQLCSVLSRTLLGMEKVASQVMGKQFLPSVGSGDIPAPCFFPSLSVLKHNAPQ